MIFLYSILFPLKMISKKLPKNLTLKEVKKLLNLPRKITPIGLRNEAILKIMLFAGLRVSEVIHLKNEDLDLESGRLKIIAGKGNKDRNLLVPDKILDLLREYRRWKPRSIFFFPTLKGKSLSPFYIWVMIKRKAKKAGIKSHCSPHTLRHTFATEFYRKTQDLEALRLCLGHENISTTQIYLSLANLEVELKMKNFDFSPDL